MKKILLCAALLCAISAKLFAQTSSDDGKFSIGVNAGLPIGSSNTPFYSFIIGGDLKYSMPIATNLSVSLSAGYSNIFGKTFTQTYSSDGFSETVSGKTPSLGAVPVKVGLRYSQDVVGFFGEVQAGATFLTRGGGTAFAYAPAVGYAFDGGIEAGVRYEGWAKNGTFSQIALRVAYSF